MTCTISIKHKFNGNTLDLEEGLHDTKKCWFKLPWLSHTLALNESFSVRKDFIVSIGSVCLA